MTTGLGGRSLAARRPDLAAQWQSDANGGLSPEDVTCGLDRKVWWLCPQGHLYDAAIRHRVVNGSGCSYCSNRRVLAGYNDLATTHPALAAQWHPTRNGALTAGDVIAGANVKRWWQCDAGHEWEVLSSHRAGPRRVGCPYCSHIRVNVGHTDLASTHPAVAAQWHPSRNGLLTPQEVVAGSDRKVWWQCERGHPYEAACSARTGPKVAGCPYCSGRRVMVGYSDLATTHPAIAAEWHPTLNGDISPASVSRGKPLQVSWLCSEGHIWREAVAVRTGRDTSCPYCQNRRSLLPGVNDLATTHPGIAEQWHPTLNGALIPTDVTAGSARPVWWQCGTGHSWEAVCYSRTGPMRTGCPYCANKALLPGYNDLATTDPELSAEWHPALNGTLTPQQVLGGSGQAAWWKCSQGHEWRSVISSRMHGARSCPICSGSQVLSGYNDLATTHPNVAAHWHRTLNGKLQPQDIRAGSGRLVWWSCERGHDWRAQTASRTGPLRTGCPFCTNKAVLPGYNDLATTHPELAAQWHPTRNTPLTSADVTAGTAKKIWWLCDRGHEWPAMGSNRARLGVGCPDCAPGGFSPNSPGATYVISDGTAHKVGVMGWDGQRLESHRQQGWRLERAWYFLLGRDAYNLEQEVVRCLRHELHLPTGYLAGEMPQSGFTETAAARDITLSAFCALVEACAKQLGLVTVTGPPAGTDGTLWWQRAQSRLPVGADPRGPGTGKQPA